MWVHRLSGNPSYNPKVYHDELKKRNVGFACEPGKIDKIESFEKPKVVYAYCIEPIDANINLINDIFKEMKLDTTTVKIVKMAMNSYTGFATFPKLSPKQAGTEDLGMEHGGGTNNELVPMSNLDTFVAEHKIADTIDFVSIDTEGFDAETIIGFSKTLVTKYVRLLEFEYHSARRWQTSDLQMIITMLDLWNYDCFWQGHKDELWRLTGCWHSGYYHNRAWSNVVCINRKEVTHPWFVTHSKKYM